MKLDYESISTQVKKADTQSVRAEVAPKSLDLSQDKQIQLEYQLKPEKQKRTSLVARWKKVDERLVCYWHKE